jgi:glyoxylase-like metal-dependent hydrolase (beta-lactamase superfamily II)
MRRARRQDGHGGGRLGGVDDDLVRRVAAPAPLGEGTEPSGLPTEEAPVSSAAKLMTGRGLHLTDFAGTPAWITAEEHRFIEDTAFAMEIAYDAGAHYEEYRFDDKPYFGFPRSRDVYGDGAIVVVPAPGHTPGSVIIFVTLHHPGRRYAFGGDLVWQLEGITQREERPWLMRRSVDMDEQALRRSMVRMISIHERYPGIAIVPSHDQRAYADIPRLPSELNGWNH